MKNRILFLLVALLLVACLEEAPLETPPSGNAGPATPLTQTAVSILTPESNATGPTTTTTSPNLDWTTAWMVNTSGQTSAVYAGVAVDVTAVYTKSENGVDYQCIQASGIPSYSSNIDTDTIDTLTSRPHVDTDFGSGAPEIGVGDVVAFGQDIGYDPRNGCTEGQPGAGYFPPGPICPSDQNKEWCFALEPQPQAAEEVCSTGLNQIGAYVNGVSIFNWQDGQSYNNENVWINDAYKFERYDVDICAGHAANGNYHHHSNPVCLQEQLGDDGSAPSPIYGFAADGYPIYGPWERAGILAQSCWQTRDYDDPNSPTGCGVAGERSCLLVDQYDISQGTTPAASGPSTGEVITSLSGNPITAVSGVYFQDYYYNAACTAQGLQYLDEHNGHETYELGYHYHITTVPDDSGQLTATFPYFAGPTYAGVLQANAVAQCRDGFGGGPGGGPGGNPGGNGPGQGPSGEPDLAAAAQQLGITEDELRAALGPPPPDFRAAADTLGITVQELQVALGVTPP